MNKFALTAIALTLGMSVPAQAETSKWNVAEISASGIKTATGAWTVNNDGGKISGSASLQFDTGATLDYKLEGEAAGGVYTVKLVGRTDDKKDCVWTGKPVEALGGRVVRGQVACEGAKFSIEAGLQ
jgi:hypothetical protein